MLIRRLSYIIIATMVPALAILLIGGVMAEENAPDMITLTITPVSAEPVPAGDPAVFKVILDNTGGQNQPDIYLDLNWDPQQIQRARLERVEGETTMVNTQGVHRTEGRARWRGGIFQDGKLTLLLTLWPVICYNDPISVNLTAESGQQGGDPLLEAAQSLQVNCPPNNFTADNITFISQIDRVSPYEVFDTEADVLKGMNAQVRMQLTNDSDEPLNALVTASLEPKPGQEDVCGIIAVLVGLQTEGAPTLSFDRGYLPPGLDRAEVDGEPYLGLMIQELKPGDTWTAAVKVPLRGRIPGCEFSGMAKVYPAPADPIPGSCQGGSPNCRYRGWTTQAKDLNKLFSILDSYDSNTIRARQVASDLGDAPASENNFDNEPMTAYSGTAANFPTVFNTALGFTPTVAGDLIQADHYNAPLHLQSQPLRLGNLASVEREADINPRRNIHPLQDQANLDTRDDGWPRGELPQSCQPFEQKIRITVEDWAVDYFKNNGGTAYLNVFVDANGDGDWEDVTTCGPDTVPEHIFINLPIFIADLGAGQHEIELPANKGINWQTDQTWLRVTLSEQPAPLSLMSGDLQHGDGRGPEEGYLMGETEDYRFRVGNVPDSVSAFGADLALRMETDYQFMANHTSDSLQGAFDIQATDCLTCIDPCYGGSLLLTVGNLGDSFGRDSTLLIFPDSSLKSNDVQISVEGDLPWIDILSMDYACSASDPDCRIEVDLGDIPPGEIGSMVVYASAMCREGSQACKKTEYTVQAKIESADDDKTGNNQAQNIIKLPLPPEWLEPPALTYPIPGTTVGGDLNVRGTGIPGRTVEVYIDGVRVAAGDVNNDGSFEIGVTSVVKEGNIANFQLAVGYEIPGGKRNPTKPVSVVLDNGSGMFFDPMSLVFTYIEQDNLYKFHPWDESGRVDLNGWQVPLIDGADYEVTVGVSSWYCLTCTMNLENNGVALKYGDNEILATLVHEGGGLWNGSFTAGKAILDEPLYLSFISEGEEQIFAGQSRSQTLPKLIDGQTGQVVDGADFLVWQGVRVSGGDTVWIRPAEMNGQAVPRKTDTNGQFFFNVAPGLYRLGAILEEGEAPILTEPERLFGIYPSRNVVVNRPDFGSDIQSLTSQEVKVSITDDGFNPPVVEANTADIITWQNISLQERGVLSEEDGINSGFLPPNGRFSFSFAEPGTYHLVDPQDPQNRFVVNVTAGPAGGNIYLPVALRP